MPKVNLVPKEERAREYRRQFYIVPVAASLLILGALGGSYYYYNNQLTNADEQLQQIKNSNAGLQKQVAELDGYQEVKNRKQAEQTVVNNLYSQRVRWSRTMDDLTFVIPDDVWLISIKANAPGVQSAQQKATASPTSTSEPDFAVEGYTREMPSVATFMLRLGLIPALGDVVLVSAEKEILSDQLVVHFKISASVKQTVEPQQATVAPNTGESGPSNLTPTTGTSTTPTTGTTGTNSRTTATTR